MPKRANEPLRRCLVSRDSRPKEQLVRFVIDPDGRVRIDVAGRLPGRGMWLSARRDVVDRAVGRNVFARAAGQRVEVTPSLADEAERLLAARALDALGLARRAGEFVTGFEKVRQALRQDEVAVLVEASDGAADGQRKLRSLAPDVPCITAFGRHEIGAAIGRDEVVHAAVAPGALARRLLIDVERLEGFRPGALERGWRMTPRPDDGEAQTMTGPR